MKRFLCILTGIVIFSSLSFAQINWKEELKKDAVVIKNNKMTMEEFVLVSGVDEAGDEFSLQGRIYSEATTDGFISRDNFIAWTVAMYLPFFLVIGETTTLPELIGNPDFEYNIYMTSGGVQMEVKDHTDNTAQRFTYTWDQIFAGK